jgi:hypothetical protein
MLDVFGIGFTILMVVLVIIKAVQLDRTEPWFQTFQPRKNTQTTSSKPWQRNRPT